MSDDHMEPTHVMTREQWEITKLRPLVDASEKMIKQAAVEAFKKSFAHKLAQKEK